MYFKATFLLAQMTNLRLGK